VHSLAPESAGIVALAVAAIALAARSWWRRTHPADIWLPPVFAVDHILTPRRDD
jgi:protein-S-isoprenylcysteine O-methyltransferase Ste14